MKKLAINSRIIVESILFINIINEDEKQLFKRWKKNDRDPK